MEAALVKAVVDLDVISKNVSHLKAMTKDGTVFMAVVKANGYGHGAVQVAKKAIESGASWLGVARLHEAVELRNAGITAPILVFGHVDPSHMDRVLELNITLSVYNLKIAKALSTAAAKLDKTLNCHLKVDTGMGRVGMVVSEPEDQKKFNILLDDIVQIANLPGIHFQGIYTHFAAADHADKTYTIEQLERFTSWLSAIKEKNIQIQIVHAANSAGIILFPQAHFNMVRAGISLYGFYPSKDVDKAKINLFPAMRLTSLITSIKDVPKGFKTSYGMTYETPAPTQLASVPIGYADGFSRSFSNNGTMLVRGIKAPIVGRVCMDQTMIDVGHIPNVAPGDEVVIFGQQGSEILSADDLADRVGTINYEIVSALTSRVERVYSDSGSG